MMSGPVRASTRAFISAMASRRPDAVRIGPLLLGILLITACGSSAPDLGNADTVGSTDGTGLGRNLRTLKVVTTVSPITSIVENIGGSRIELEGLVPEGVNSHTFAPAPSIAKVISEADLIVLNGLLLEEPTLEMARANKKSEAVILSLGEQSVSEEDWQYDFTFSRSDGQPNPHLWPDPLLALRYAELVEDHLAELDPANADYYSSNLDQFRQRIMTLDEGIVGAVATIPAANRKLLTYHDSWAYFAERYGMQVIGAVQPSNFSQPSVREVVRLIDQIKDLNIPAVFGSEVFPSDVLETIAAEAGAQFIDELADDDLPGGPGDPWHSYLGLMLQNMGIMIPALGGNVQQLAGFDASPVFQGQSRAIYPQ